MVDMRFGSFNMMIFHIEIVIMSIIKSKKVRSYKEKCLSADNKC